MSAKHDISRRRRRRRVLAHLQGQRCYLCAKGFGRKKWQWPTADHVVPQALGGRWGENILMAHNRCNHQKGDRAPYPCELLYLAAINLRLASA